jgi:hypothetical protein
MNFVNSLLILQRGQDNTLRASRPLFYNHVACFDELAPAFIRMS